MSYWYYVNGTKSTRSWVALTDCGAAIPSVHIERGAEVVVFDDRPNRAYPWSIVSREDNSLVFTPQTERPKTVKGIDPIMYNIYFRDVTPGPEDDDPLEEDCGELFIDYHCEDFNEVYRMVQEWGQGYWNEDTSEVGLDHISTDMGIVDYRTGRTRAVDIWPVNKRSLRYLKKAAKAWGVK